MSEVRDLPATWRERAAQIRRYAPEAAAAFEDAASDLERELREADNDVLTLPEAQRESGYSADHLGRLLKAGCDPERGSETRAAHSPGRSPPQGRCAQDWSGAEGTHYV